MDERRQIAAHLDVSRQGRPQPRGAGPPVEEEQASGLESREEEQAEAGAEEGSSPPEQPAGRSLVAHGPQCHESGQQRNHRHQEAAGRTLPAPPHSPGERRSQHRGK
jgi:hypothetical protein